MSKTWKYILIYLGIGIVLYALIYHWYKKASAPVYGAPTYHGGGYTGL